MNPILELLELMREMLEEMRKLRAYFENSGKGS